MDPMTMMALASAASGFLGHSKMPKEQRDLYRISLDAARRLHQQGTGVPGSDPGQMAALAQDQALLGEQQAMQRNQLMGQMGMNPQMGMMPDFLANLGSNQVAQRMALSSQHMMAALAQRTDALRAAAGTAQGTAGLAQNPQQGSALPQLFSQLASQYAFQKAYKRPGATTTGADGGNQGFSPWGTASTQGASPWTNMPGAPSGWTVPNPDINPYNSGQQAGITVAPGNEPFAGTNGVNNQIRQGSGFGRSFLLPGGLRFG